MILLDTHIWLWLLHDPSQLSQAAQKAIESEESQNGLLVSVISVSKCEAQCCRCSFQLIISVGV
ncbi:type II toxin-antitoxin system VapC family toxin [Sphaerospermopsis aphanizomenoides]|uniref:type II toxin-antitoxin system VapC family toxin n=1 Tax=Sphaerospermopsis aphanizomenoides TaxID=459663 RepID=UPI001F41F58B|nr:hypothetical protein [Sphaerospermopsis aphanizomenoides]